MNKNCYNFYSYDKENDILTWRRVNINNLATHILICFEKLLIFSINI